MVNGPACVFFKYLSYPKIREIKTKDIPNVGTPTNNDKLRAMAVNIVTRTIATFLDILPDARGLVGLSFLSML
jgi:hypothetical protein